MPHAPIYLFKSARRPIYRKENLDLLAAERGSVQEYAWNRTWVAPAFFEEGSIARGQPVYIVFTDRPFEHFVPVRDGEIAGAAWDETLLRLKVILNNPVAVPEGGLAAFTARVNAAGTPVPGEKFVVPKADDVELRALFDEEEIPGWRRSVDEVLAMSRASEGRPYERCVFFRPGGSATPRDLVQIDVSVDRTTPSLSLNRSTPSHLLRSLLWWMHARTSTSRERIL